MNYSTNSLDVFEDWRRWCRLCAKADTRNKNTYHDGEETFAAIDDFEHSRSGLLIGISKYFLVEINRNDELPKQLCAECVFLVTSLASFKERVLRVQEMYNALNSPDDNAPTDLSHVRLKYGVLENDWPHEFMYRSLSGEDIHEEIKIDEERNLVQEVDEKITIEESYSDFNIFDAIPLRDKDDKDGSDFKIEENLYEDPIGGDDLIDNKSTEIDKTLSENNSIENFIYNKEMNNNGSNTEDEEIKSEVESDEEKIYTCHKCSKDFEVFDLYRSHMRNEHAKSDVNPQFACSQCNLKFNTSIQLSLHCTIEHMPITKSRVLPCPRCEQKFLNKTTLKGHIKFVHLKVRPFICEVCGKAVHSKDSLKHHMLTHTNNAPFECDVCKKCFKNNIRLKKHMESHSEEGFTCTECGLQLSTRSTLNQHLLVHSDVRRHKCDYCGRAFKRAKELKNHLIAHIGLKPYSCDFCERTFNNSSNCRAHRKKAHPEEVAASGEKSFKWNVPKLSMLKSVVQTTENLAPVISRRRGKLSSHRKPDSIVEGNQTDEIQNE